MGGLRTSPAGMTVEITMFGKSWPDMVPVPETACDIMVMSLSQGATFPSTHTSA